MSTNDHVHLHYEEVDTLVPLDSTLHVFLFDILDEERYPMTPLTPVIQLHKQLSIDTFFKLRKELMKAGFWRHRLQGCDSERIDLLLPPYASEKVGFHDERVVSRLPPQPPLPDLPLPIEDSTTIVAILEHGSPRYHTGTGVAVQDLRQHLLKHEKVMHLYKPIKGTTYDDLFRFYSDVTRILEQIRGPREPDSVYLEMRARYPMRIARYPEDLHEWDDRMDTIDARP